MTAVLKKSNVVKREFIPRRPEHDQPVKGLSVVPRSTDGQGRARTPRHVLTQKQLRTIVQALAHAMNDRYDGVNAHFAKDMGIRHQATMYWLRSGVIPAERVMDVVDVMHHELITPELLRPDVFRPSYHDAD